MNYTAYKNDATRLQVYRDELIELYKTALLHRDRREARRLWELRRRVEQALAPNDEWQVEERIPALAA